MWSAVASATAFQPRVGKRWLDWPIRQARRDAPPPHSTSVARRYVIAGAKAWLPARALPTRPPVGGRSGHRSTSSGFDVPAEQRMWSAVASATAFQPCVGKRWLDLSIRRIVVMRRHRTPHALLGDPSLPRCDVVVAVKHFGVAPEDAASAACTAALRAFDGVMPVRHWRVALGRWRRGRDALSHCSPPIRPWMRSTAALPSVHDAMHTDHCGIASDRYHHGAGALRHCPRSISPWTRVHDAIEDAHPANEGPPCRHGGSSMRSWTLIHDGNEPVHPAMEHRP